MVTAQDVEMAYKTACLGVTEADWRSLALETLQVSEMASRRSEVSDTSWSL